MSPGGHLSDGVSPSPDPVAGGELVVAISSETDGFVPATIRWTSAGLYIARAIYDPLAAFTAEGDVVPYLAASIEANDDFTVWTIGLRDGVTFHDCTPLDAEAVVANLQAVQASLILGPSFAPVSEVSAIDAATVRVTMSSPWANFPALIAQQPGFIAHPDVLTGVIEDPVGTGPFTFETWILGDRLEVERNPDYWCQGLPYLDGIEFQVVIDELTRESGLQSGEFDLLHTAIPARTSALTTTDGTDDTYAVWSEGAEDEQLVLFNTQAGPASDVEVRRALNLVLDREQLVADLYDGAVTVADLPYTESSRWYSDVAWPEPDVAEAERLISEWEAENGDLVLTIMTVAETSVRTEVQYLSSVWEAIGVEVQIESVDTTAVVLRAVTGDFEVTVIPLFNSPDPDGDFHFLDPDGVSAPGEIGLAVTRYESDTLAANLETGRATGDLAERQAAYALVYQEIANEVPIIWLYRTPWVFEVADRVQGIETFSLPDTDADPLLVNWGSLFLTEAFVAE